VAVAAVHGTVHKVPGTGFLKSFACPSRGSCIAAGATSNAQYQTTGGVVVPVSGGKPGAAKAVSGSLEFGAVACPSAKHCLAVGATTSGAGALLPITGGRPGKLVTVPGTIGLYGVSCGTASSCWATTAGGTEAEVVHIVNGAVSKVYGLKGSYPYMFRGSEAGSPSPLCTSASSCLAVGTKDLTNGPGLVLRLTNGKISSSRTVPGVDDFVGLGCAGASVCVAAGYTGNHGVVVPIVDGKPGTVHRPSAVTYLGAVACASKTKCFAFGYGGVANRKYMVVPITDGKPGRAQTISFYGLGAWCGTLGCVAVGDLPGSSGPEGVFYPFS
jgi:hypothetical protein